MMMMQAPVTMVRGCRGNVLVYTRLGSQRGAKPENNCSPHALGFLFSIYHVEGGKEKHTSMK